MISVCMQNRILSDDTISDTSRRSAMLKFTAMISTAFVSSDTASADDEAEIFAEESDEIDEFLYDEEEEDLNVFEPTDKPGVSGQSNEIVTGSDPWDRFTPRVTPTDESALSQAFANNVQPVTPTKVVRAQSKQKSMASTTKPNPISSADQELSTDHMDAGSLFALSFPLIVLSGAYYSFERKKSIDAYYSQGTPKVKVVMIENEPYGLDKGRRYYNGVNVVREFCDASKPRASNECVNSIAEFLDNVSHTSNTGEENQQTASAIISYLDSLSSRGSNVAPQNSAPQATGVAFSSYLQGLSEGSIRAPSSAESVAVYLNTLASTERERLSRLETRVDNLEASMDDKVARELNTIATILVEQCGQGRDVHNDSELNGSRVNECQNIIDPGFNGHQASSFELGSAGGQVINNEIDGAHTNLPML